MSVDKNVVIIDDNEVLANLIKKRINELNGFNCEYYFTNPILFLNSELHADIVLLDILMPQMNGLDAIELILKSNPKCSIIMNSIKNDTETIFDSLKKGAVGYIDKQTYNNNFDDVLYSVANGGAYMTPAISLKVIDSFKRVKSGFEVLTKRENEIANAILEGLSYNSISKKLYISIDSVRSHIRNIYKKLNINSKAQLFKISKNK
jgi:DNA-binding NarL/FixJ family response regulator